MKSYNLIGLVLVLIVIVCCKNNNANTTKIEALISAVPADTVVSAKNQVQVTETRVSVEEQSKGNYYLKNDSMIIQLSVSSNEPSSIRFNLKHRTRNKIERLGGLAKLILIEDSDGSMIVPEGTAILDRNTDQEYFCDSTFMFNSEKVNMSFAFEVGTKKRLSLIIYNSKIQSVKDNEYTLYREDK